MEALNSKNKNKNNKGGGSPQELYFQYIPNTGKIKIIFYFLNILSTIS